jgi:hypothetical protein
MNGFVRRLEWNTISLVTRPPDTNNGFPAGAATKIDFKIIVRCGERRSTVRSNDNNAMANLNI